ncbi:helix-turn-helix domain-containing protein [Brevibacillus agri]
MRQYTEFGLEARRIMLLKNIKMTDIAKALGVSSAYIGDILRGSRPGKKHKPLIAEMLGIDLKQFEGNEVS